MTRKAGIVVGGLLVGILMGCDEREQPSVSPVSTSSRTVSEAGGEPIVTPVARGVMGLEVGMTPQQIGQNFLIKEGQDPVVGLLKRYGKPDEAEVASQINEATKKQFFKISSGVRKLPDGVTSADAYATHNIVYQIGLHYDVGTKKIRWEDVVYPYVAKYGKPIEEGSSKYVWKDGRSRLEIAASGSMINVFFTDGALERELKKEQNNNP